MTRWSDRPIRTAADVAAFENEMPLQERLTERSVYDVFDGGSRLAPEAVALTMLMTGTVDEQPRRVTYAELAGLVRQAANAFHTLAGPRPGVAYLLPSLVETHAVLWGAQSVRVRRAAQLLVAAGPPGGPRPCRRRPGARGRSGRTLRWTSGRRRWRFGTWCLAWRWWPSTCRARTARRRLSTWRR